MIKEDYISSRELKTVENHYDVVVAGGGLAGVCASITAAREGARVALLNDRPVLGGNSSSEVRLWALGATSHMGNNNRWAREGGIIDEIMVENLYRNREGNPVIFDTVLIDKVMQEPGIDLYLNTAVFSVQKTGEEKIEKIMGFNSQNSTIYAFSGEMFIDASGDGILSYQAGVPFRMGAENSDEFDEPIAVNKDDFGELLGHTLFFYSKRAEKPVKYVAPSFALKDYNSIPKIHKVKAGVDGCNLWWFEYGGQKDTVHETEEIKFELWKVAYGVWDYIKNSGKFDNADQLTLEWVGLIPGKRESRRFEGNYMLRQSDIVEQKEHFDAISFGGWAIDLHPSEGIYSELDSCSQWHSKGVYQIPFRCYFPKKIKNLLFAGRIISVSHIAFGSTRVMATTAHGGQAVGMAAAICVQKGITPEVLLKKEALHQFQQKLLQTGHYIPGIANDLTHNLISSARIAASSSLSLSELPHNGGWEKLVHSKAQMLPSPGGILPGFTIGVRAGMKTELQVQLRISSKPGNHTPDILLKEENITLEKGVQQVDINFNTIVEEGKYLFLCLMKNENVEVALSLTRITGILSLYNQTNGAVSNYGKQVPAPGSGIDEFEFWTPKRRPNGLNMALMCSSPIQCFSPEQLLNGYNRPVAQPNAWVAEFDDEHPVLELSWDKSQLIREVRLFLDSDYDHPMESVQMNHPEDRIPFCLRDYTLEDEHGKEILRKQGNYQTMNSFLFSEPVQTGKLVFRFEKPAENIPAGVFSIICR
ncbi:MAG: FAD-dependent oxidoreductase [Bacteroidales bacterium]|nr:FAD-dependent oxidoreductase [Bacteroidales bacterium]MDT8430716.1 FAD-dependent oxidoreductase [Bacteroidales bacterium]